ncbi:DUF2977 domain-containing protein [Pediococcus pentosaceus]|uniref:DUF2977 domain-containing protein n=1 Tax=Pediococcus pentosaceus TaxID=1255 RepID=UPI0018FE6730|nr:DUF2977 domain-containing protein [Pediococcus pentosaceus]MBF7122813.1 DUF2977 domain-containing protein [Pediococcus pentosaceus]
MKLLLDDKKIIIGMAVIGSIEGAIDYSGLIPDGFEEQFKPNFYMLKNNLITENPDYVEPSNDVPTGPNSLQQIVMQQAITIAKMQQMLMQQNKDIAALKGANV